MSIPALAVFFGDDRKECTCSIGFVQRYQKRISGPLMDRIDGPEMRGRRRRAVQAERFAPLGKPHVLVNGDMGPAEMQDFCSLDDRGINLMRAAVKQSAGFNFL